MQNENEPAPLGATMTPSQVKKLKIAIAIMSVMLVAGFILLLVGIYLQTQKMSKKPDVGGLTVPVPQAGMPGMTGIQAPAGAELRQMLVERGHLILHLRHAKGDEVAIIDLSSGREIQRFKLMPQ